MAITASMVKELRELTGAGMMECKKALEEAQGNTQEAVVILRKRGQAKAAKRAGKIAAEGIIVIAESNDRRSAFMAEINCETDFVARDTNFREYAGILAKQGLQLKTSDVETLLASQIDSRSLEQMRQELMTKIGENVQLRRAALLESTGMVGSYIHGDRIGVLIALDKNLPELAKDIAMHIAASNPQAIDENSLPADLIQKEREIYLDQAKTTGKPQDIIEKMVAGRLTKFMQEVCLVGQPFVKNPDQTIGKLLQTHQAKVTAFLRFEVGEGIEKEVVDFAEEVRAQVQSD